jgi:hypothetical protein
MVVIDPLVCAPARIARIWTLGSYADRFFVGQAIYIGEAGDLDVVSLLQVAEALRLTIGSTDSVLLLPCQTCSVSTRGFPLISACFVSLESLGVTFAPQARILSCLRLGTFSVG